jgi:hypothetical protein
MPSKVAPENLKDLRSRAQRKFLGKNAGHRISSEAHSNYGQQLRITPKTGLDACNFLVCGPEYKRFLQHIIQHLEYQIAEVIAPDAPRESGARERVAAIRKQCAPVPS